MKNQESPLKRAITSLAGRSITYDRKKDLNSSKRFHDALLNATRQFETEHDRFSAFVTCECWLKHFSRTLVNTLSHSAYAEEIDSFINILLDHHITDALLKDQRRARVMANACMNRLLTSLEADSSEPHLKEHKILKVLEQWAGKKAPDDTCASLENLCAYLYGPGAWPLYRGDVQDDDELPMFLYEINAPVVALTNSNNKNEQHITLPTSGFDTPI